LTDLCLRAIGLLEQAPRRNVLPYDNKIFLEFFRVGFVPVGTIPLSDEILIRFA